MIKRIILIVVLCVPVLLLLAVAQTEEDVQEDKRLEVVNYVYKSDRNTDPSVDHSRFEILKQTFADAHEMTSACLSCHTERHKEIMANNHWTWSRKENIEGRGVIELGKKNILNNFCIGVSGSEGTCTRCHIGYGWKDKSFDFNEPTNIDCLVCHDNTGSYKKEKGAAGYPKANVDLNYVAQNVGKTGRENCGVCHFWGGGGNNVKHGDLEKAMLDCGRDVDVHMTTEGENMSCTECHVTEKHLIAGKVYSLSSENKNRASCEHCHTSTPHNDDILDEHNCRVACQTCHIPIYAKENGTKMIWDWSTSGRLDEDGHELHEYDADGNHNYLSIKGNFVYDDNVTPEYFWFNGIADHYLMGDPIDSIPLQMNTLDGSYRDKGSCQKSNAPSKIWPVKVHRGSQIYDPVNNMLIQPKLWDKEAGTGAYWKDFDYNVASQIGMEYVGLPYSGEFDFVETEMYWPLNHQVSPADQSLTCIDCHTRNDGRLANLTDFYLPGRDYHPTIETAGISMIVLALLGIIFHGICRVVFGRSCYIQKLTEGGDES